LRKRSIIISILCLLLALPSGALAEGNTAQTPQTIKVESGNQQAVKSDSITVLADEVLDSLGPVLESATVSPTTVGVGDELTITATASDDLTGVAQIIAYLNLPDGGYKLVPLVQDPLTGEWKGTYTIAEFDQDGTWIIDFDLFDRAGNDSYGEPVEPVQVNNPNGGDTEKPTLVDKTVTPLNVGPNEEVKITATVNDNVGVESVYAKIYTADSTGYYYVPLTLV
jgi:hypothetical protein